MSHFKARMHQIRFRLGCDPDSAGGAYSVPPDSLPKFEGPISEGGEEEREKSRGDENERGKERRE